MQALLLRLLFRKLLDLYFVSGFEPLSFDDLKYFVKLVMFEGFFFLRLIRPS